MGNWRNVTNTFSEERRHLEKKRFMCTITLIHICGILIKCMGKD